MLLLLLGERRSRNKWWGWGCVCDDEGDDDDICCCCFHFVDITLSSFSLCQWNMSIQQIWMKYNKYEWNKYNKYEWNTTNMNEIQQICQLIFSVTKTINQNPPTQRPNVNGRISKPPHLRKPKKYRFLSTSLLFSSAHKQRDWGVWLSIVGSWWWRYGLIGLSPGRLRRGAVVRLLRGWTWRSDRPVTLHCRHHNVSALTYSLPV